MGFFKHWSFKLIVFVVLFVTSTILYARYIGTKRFEVREYRVESEVLTSNFSGLKVVHFSDLLYGSTVDMDDVKKMVNRINILKPDLVLFTGDLISMNYKISDSEKEKFRPVFQRIDPDINMDYVRLVEFCWYNGCEAPDYYDPQEDPFYKEL